MVAETSITRLKDSHHGTKISGDFRPQIWSRHTSLSNAQSSCMKRHYIHVCGRKSIYTKLDIGEVKESMNRIEWYWMSRVQIGNVN